MADKTTTLKTKTNDNVYPNIIGDNRDNAIVDSAHIKHTLTAEHKINFRLDDNVSKLIFNSLQKPAGLTKTELVGVGTNGQENIEIGDNLTLANGKLSATGGGGDLPELVLTNNDGSFTGDIINSKSGIYSVSIITNGNKIKNTGICNIYDFIVNDAIYKIVGGYYADGDAFSLISNDFANGNPNNIILNIVPMIENDLGVQGNSIVYTTTNNKIDFLYSPDVANQFLTYNIATETFEWSTPTFNNILPLPADASTSTYVLKAVNGVIKWVKES